MYMHIEQLCHMKTSLFPHTITSVSINYIHNRKQIEQFCQTEDKSLYLFCCDWKIASTVTTNLNSSSKKKQTSTRLSM